MSDDWRRDAACKGKDPDIFFPPSVGPYTSYTQAGWTADDAKRICAACPVADQCFDDAIANRDRWSVRAGVEMWKKNSRVSTQRRRHAGDTLPLRCAWCRQPFTPTHPTQAYCGAQCAADGRRRQQEASRRRSA